MSIINPGRKIYRTMNGTPVELDKLIMRNETTLAVGNAKVNARGDTIGPGGKIVKKHEDAVAENTPTSDNVVSQAAKSKPVIQPMQPAPIVQPAASNKPRSTRSTATDAVEGE